MHLETEFLYKHGDLLRLTSDEGQGAILIVHTLVADVCPAGVVQRKYGCRVTWRDIGRDWIRDKPSNRLQKIDRELTYFCEIELVPYVPVANEPAEGPYAKVEQALEAAKNAR